MTTGDVLIVEKQGVKAKRDGCTIVFTCNLGAKTIEVLQSKGTVNETHESVFTEQLLQALSQRLGDIPYGIHSIQTVNIDGLSKNIRLGELKPGLIKKIRVEFHRDFQAMQLMWMLDTFMRYQEQPTLAEPAPRISYRLATAQTSEIAFINAFVVASSGEQLKMLQAVSGEAETETHYPILLHEVIKKLSAKEVEFDDVVQAYLLQLNLSDMQKDLLRQRKIVVAAPQALILSGNFPEGFIKSDKGKSLKVGDITPEVFFIFPAFASPFTWVGTKQLGNNPQEKCKILWSNIKRESHNTTEVFSEQIKHQEGPEFDGPIRRTIKYAVAGNTVVTYQNYLEFFKLHTAQGPEIVALLTEDGHMVGHLETPSLRGGHVHPIVHLDKKFCEQQNLIILMDSYWLSPSGGYEFMRRTQGTKSIFFSKRGLTTLPSLGPLHYVEDTYVGHLDAFPSVFTNLNGDTKVFVMDKQFLLKSAKLMGKNLKANNKQFSPVIKLAVKALKKAVKKGRETAIAKLIGVLWGDTPIQVGQLTGPSISEVVYWNDLDGTSTERPELPLPPPGISYLVERTEEK